MFHINNGLLVEECGELTEDKEEPEVKKSKIYETFSLLDSILDRFWARSSWVLTHVLYHISCRPSSVGRRPNGFLGLHVLEWQDFSIPGGLIG